MRRDYGDFKEALDKVIARILSGHWRHGIKTKDVVREMLRLARFPEDSSLMWDVRYRKRTGEFLKHAFYYWAQSNIKNRRGPFYGKSGTQYRLRLIHNVEHGNDGDEVEGDEDLELPAQPPDKEGLWLRRQDLRLKDVLRVRKMYKRRKDDARSDVKYLENAMKVLDGLPDDTTCGDVEDEIADLM